MATEIMPLQNDTNIAILNAIKYEASTDYQRRIPDATKANVQGMLKELSQRNTLRNEFLDALINRIGSVFARNISWQNPLAEFKRGMLAYGDTIEEIQIGLLKAHAYDTDREYLEQMIFGTERPDVKSNFHHVNRQDFYKITVNEKLLQRAFLEDSGLATFVGQLMQAPSTSDQWDEFLLTVRLFSEYESNGGFYHVNVPDVVNMASDSTDAKEALRKLRAMAGTIMFPSTKYNAAHMPTFATPEDLILFCTPEFNAAVDVEALAGAFNMEKAEATGRIIQVPQENFNIPGAQAIMTTKDFFVIADQRLENSSQYNPVSLSTNYFLHHWEVVSASRFVPAVLFHTGDDDEVIEISSPVVSLAAIVVTDADGNVVTGVAPGMIYAAASSATTNPVGGEATVRWSVSGQASTSTHITQNGVLHVGADETAALTLTAKSVWLDPTNLRSDPVSVTAALTLTGATVPAWPLTSSATGITVTILGHVIPIVVGTAAYTFVEPTVFKASDVLIESTEPISSEVTVAAQVATVTIDLGTGAPVVYTLTATAT